MKRVKLRGLPPNFKKVEWIGSSLKDMHTMPGPVQHAFGKALYFAQCGTLHVSAKPLQHIKGGGVLEIVENYDSDTYRAVYTVKFKLRIYVLHVFQKKSARGIVTSQHDIDVIKTRLRQAQQEHQQLEEKLNGNQ